MSITIQQLIQVITYSMKEVRVLEPRSGFTYDQNIIDPQTLIDVLTDLDKWIAENPPPP